jgi:hypothetical protein
MELSGQLHAPAALSGEKARFIGDWLSPDSVYMLWRRKEPLSLPEIEPRSSSPQANTYIN